MPDQEDPWSGTLPPCLEEAEAQLQCPVAGNMGDAPLAVLLHLVGAEVATTMKVAADDVTGVVIPECGRFPVEEAPRELPAALRPFIAPYRDRGRSASGSVGP
ncbi:hypothetical protein ACFWGE_15200 [Streptomyces bacillaris]|uniref:hypothetical protein n=1 Tax=Streptomyces TaxID=1883 RepID=UPI00115320DC|nr:hypothetical protein [Streptomyces cavourensis]GGU71966.1 hypothetical protein GCM10010498_32340 [Streptomyces cavourensis]